MSSVVAPCDYIGRFAPSPTGPLHFGSAVAALASFLQARGRGGQWFVRIEDIDPPRERAGASKAILEALFALGLEWDGEVHYQSHRSQHYDAALEQLRAAGETFACACTRRQLPHGPYPGTCRNGIAAGLVGHSVRLRVRSAVIDFHDLLQGSCSQSLAREVGDYIVRRADGLYAYHLAAVVDDAAAGVTEIVRGVDLLESTPRQIYLQRLLGLHTPNYAHIPVVLNRDGAKLSKQTAARPVDPSTARRVLVAALEFLQQSPPPDLSHRSRDEIIQWALAHWNIGVVGNESHISSM